MASATDIVRRKKLALLVSGDVPADVSGEKKITAAKSNGYMSQVFGLAIFVLGGAELLTVLDGTVVALAIPRISLSIRLRPEAAAWIVSAYVLAFASFLLVGGKFGDAYGRKKVFISGVAILSFASLVTGFCQTFPQLLACRMVQGVGAALAAPNAMAYVATIYKPGKMRSSALGIYGAMMGLGSVLGLTIGGIVATRAWQWVFWINVPIGVLIVIGACIGLPSLPGQHMRIDYSGAVLLTTGFCGIVVAISTLTYSGDVSYSGTVRIVGIIAAVIGVLSLIASYFVERKSPDPIIPVALLRNRNRVLALVVTLCAGAVMTCMAVYTAQYFQAILHYSPARSGFAVLPFAGGIAIAMGLIGFVSQHVAPRWIIICSGCLIIGSFMFIWLMILHYPGYFPWFFTMIGVVGFGVGFIMTSILLSVLAGVKPHETGVLSAVQKIVMDLGGGAGLIVISSLQSWAIHAMGGVIDNVGTVTGESLEILKRSYGIAIVSVASIAVVAGIVVYFMKFSVSDVMEGVAAKELADSGILEEN